jgi:hypothetical protein
LDAAIGECAANLVTVEKARKRWAAYSKRLEVKLWGLMQDIKKTKEKTMEWATMEFDCHNNLISEVTDDIYDEVSNAEPALKPPNPNRKRQTKQYVEPRLKYKKKKLEQLFLQPENHFVDCVIEHMQSSFNKAVQIVLEEHFAGFEVLLEDFSKTIRSQAPLDYKISPHGKAMRAGIEKEIPGLQERVEELQKMLPAAVKGERGMALMPMDNSDLGNGEENFAVTYARMAKRKDLEFEDGPTTKNRRIKSEPF